MEGIPFAGIGTVSQKSFPARREIFSSKARDLRMASTLELMVDSRQKDFGRPVAILRSRSSLKDR